MDDAVLHLDEASARRLVLVRAVEDVDTQGRLLGEPEREQIEREALAASQGAGGVDFTAYLQQRARRVLALVDRRDPRISAWQDAEPWRRVAMVALPAAACIFGAAIDRIGNPHQVNMLSPPLLGVLAWNLVVYLLLLASLVMPRRQRPRRSLPGLQRWLALVPRRGRGAGRLRFDVLVRFQQQWLQATRTQQWLWGEQLLHLCAAGWALGLAVSIVLGGVVREYRVGWESTLLDVAQVHALLSVLFAPVVALLPFDAFSVADLQRMAFHSQAAIGVGEARRWVWMYVALLFVVVIVPRLLLATWNGWQRRRHARAVRIDLRDPYFAQVLARVRPARITVGLLAAAGPGRDAVLRMLRQLADQPQPREHAPWTVLATARGDVLRVVEVPPAFQPPLPAAPAPVGAGPAGAQAWLHELLGRFKAGSRVRGGDAVQAALAEADLVLIVPSHVGDVEDAKRLLHWVAQPALVLAPAEQALYRDVVQRLGLAAEVLPLERSTAHWMCDAAWLDAAVARIAPGKRAGLQRLAVAWQDRNAERFAAAMRLVAGELVRSARDAEDVANAPLGLRQLVHPGERDAAQRARDGARSALLERLRDGERSVFASLVQLYRAGEPVATVAGARMDSGFSDQQPVDTPQAGLAGAATGAAMGAGIDLLTGGLTLGAAAALGAMIGGGAGYVAAAWKNRGTPTGQAQVQVGDELLQTFTESLLLAYLAAAHRSGPPGAAPAAWRSEVVAAVEARRAALAPLWERARTAADPATAVGPLVTELEALARGLLGRL